MSTYVFGTRINNEKWEYIRPQDFLPYSRFFSRKRFNRFLRSGHPEHHTKRVWHKIDRKYRRSGLVHIHGLGWVSRTLADHYASLEKEE